MDGKFGFTNKLHNEMTHFKVDPTGARRELE